MSTRPSVRDRSLPFAPVLCSMPCVATSLPSRVAAFQWCYTGSARGLGIFPRERWFIHVVYCTVRCTDSLVVTDASCFSISPLQFMDLRTRYTALVTLTTQHVKYISDALRRLEEEEVRGLYRTELFSSTFRLCLRCCSLEPLCLWTAGTPSTWLSFSSVCRK